MLARSMELVFQKAELAMTEECTLRPQILTRLTAAASF